MNEWKSIARQDARLHYELMGKKTIDPADIDSIVQKAAAAIAALPSDEKEQLFARIRRYEIVYPQVMGFAGDISKDKDVQRAFNFLYQLRLHRNPSDQYAEYYRIFEELRQPEHVRNRSFSYILQELHKSTGSWHYSFATKMLHSLDDSMPIFDRKVRLFFDIPASDGSLEERAQHYELFTRIMHALLQQREIGPLLASFDLSLESLYHISPMKKLDFIIWKLPVAR